MSPRAALVVVALELGLGWGLGFPAGLSLWLAGGGVLAWAVGTPCHDHVRPEAKPVNLPLPWLLTRRQAAPAAGRARGRGEDPACRRECERLSFRSIRRLR